MDIGISLNNIGCTLSSLSRYREAYDYISAAKQLFSLRLDPVHPRINIVRTNLDKIRFKSPNLNQNKLLSELKQIAEIKQKKLDELKEKKAAKNNKKKGGNGPSSSSATGPLTGKPNTAASDMPGGGTRSGATTGLGTSSRGSGTLSSSSNNNTQNISTSSRTGGGSGKGGKKGEEKPPEFHEDPRFFQAAVAPLLMPSVQSIITGGGELTPLQIAEQFDKNLPLRQWDVTMGAFQKIAMELGGNGGKKKSAGGKGKKKK